MGPQHELNAIILPFRAVAHCRRPLSAVARPGTPDASLRLQPTIDERPGANGHFERCWTKVSSDRS